MQLKEELILSQIIKNVYFREKIVPNIQTSYFENKEHIALFKVIREYLRDKVVVLDATTLLLKYTNIEKLNELFALEFPNENINWLISETEQWAKTQALKEAVLKAAEVINENKDLTLIDGYIKDALRINFDKDLGLNWKEDIDERFKKYNETEKVLSTGYKMFDHCISGGLPKRTLTVVLGASNLGKSNVLCNLAVGLVRNGFSGVYLSLELDKEIISRRCDSIVTNIPYAELSRNKNKVVDFFSKFKGGEYYIKSYPPSKSNSINITTYLKELEIFKKLKIDFLIVDYLNLMKPNYFNKNSNSYEKFFVVSEELREIAVEYNIPVITASQVQREAYGSSDVRMEHVRSSMGTIENCDIAISLSQTVEQEEENFITWKIIKNRFGRKERAIETRVCPETLKITEILSSIDKQVLEGEVSCERVVSENIELKSLKMEDTFGDFS